MRGRVIGWLSVRFRHGNPMADSVRFSNTEAGADADVRWGQRVRPADTFIKVPVVLPSRRPRKVRS